jgi:hypothetical protein
MIYNEYGDDSHLPPCPCEKCCYRIWAKRLVAMVDRQHKFYYSPIHAQVEHAVEQLDARIRCEMGEHPQCTMSECLYDC